jgi:hypothetical protein
VINLKATLTEDAVADAIGPLSGWARQCHAASLALVRSGLLGPSGAGGARVARGSLRDVSGQHSWAVVGDPYYPDWVVDITAWSYREGYPRVWVQKWAAWQRPHGTGSIWQAGCPAVGTGSLIPLAVEVSREAQRFLETVFAYNGRNGLDAQGWMALANSPVDGWPAAEIIAAMADTPMLKALIPIDILGMLTDRNPEKLYW